MTTLTFLDLDALRAELRRDEGVRLKPYTDTVGKLTIGVGRNLTDVGITPEEAAFLLDNDIATALGSLATKPWFNSLDPVRQRVLVNLCFNLGINGLLGFHRMIAALIQKDYERAAHELETSKLARQTGQRNVRLAHMLRTGTV